MKSGGGDMGRRGWRVLGRRIERLLAELTWLAPSFVVPFESMVAYTIMDKGENQSRAEHGGRGSITDTRPATGGERA